MAIRFQADADLRQSLATALLRRAPEIDFQTAHAAGLKGLSDPEVLALAAAEGRILVSRDKRTMPLHFGEFIKTRLCPGLLLVSQHLAVTTAVDELLLIGYASEPDEWFNRISHLPL